MKEKAAGIFSNWFGMNSNITALVFGLGIILVSLLLYFIFSRLLIRFMKKADHQNFRLGWRKLKTPFLVMILLIDFIVIKELFTIDEKIYMYLNHFIKVFVIFCVTWLLTRAINLTRELILRRYGSKR
jgi:MFS family permease